MRLIQAGDFTAYPDALRFVIATKDAGMLIADASSSKNAALFLRQIRLDTFAREHGISSPTLRPGLTLLDYFDADVSGRDFAHGKPDPEIFLTAAHELGVEPRHAIAIADASAGIQAAKAGGMAALGVAQPATPACSPRRRRPRGHHTPRRRHHRPPRRKAGHAKGITPHDNGIAPVPGYGQRVAAADSGLGNVHRLTRSAWYRRSCARRITTYRTADLARRLRQAIVTLRDSCSRGQANRAPILRG